MKRILGMLFAALSVLTYTSFSAATSLQDALSAIDSIRNSQNTVQHQVSTSLINLFVEYGAGLREISFKDVDEYVANSAFSYERTVPTNRDFGTHRLFDENGFALYLAYMPIDSSPDSTDFGNLEKEMLYCVELSRDHCSISISNQMHTQDIAYTTYSKDRATPSVKVSSLGELMDFFETKMGGQVPEELTSISYGVSDSSKITQAIQTRAKEYTGCSIADVKVSLHTSSEPATYTALVYLTWEMNNSLDKIKELVPVYSDDLAAYLAMNHDNLSEVYVFWTIPKYYDQDIAAKNSYTLSDGSAYIDARSGSLY